MPPGKMTEKRQRTQKLKDSNARQKSPNDIQKKKKSSKAKSENISTVLYRDMNIPPKVREKWKPINSSTISFVRESLDRNIIDILGCVKTPEVDEIQDLLNSLKKSLLQRMTRLKGPPNSLNTYQKLHSRLVLLEEMIDENASHIEAVSEKIEEQERIGEDLKDEIEEMERKIEEAEARLEEHDSGMSDDELEFLSSRAKPQRTNYQYLIEQIQELASNTSCTD